LYDLKPRFQALLRPLARTLYDKGITANQATVAAAMGSVVLGVVAAYAGATHPLIYCLYPVWLFARMALNAIDGMLAREFGQKSVLGMFLNELCDVVSDTALILPLAYIVPFSPAQTVTFASLAALTEFAGALGPTAGASRRYDGPLGKSDRALVIGVVALWLGVAGTLPPLFYWLMPLLCGLSAWTIFNRIGGALKEASDSARKADGA